MVEFKIINGNIDLLSGISIETFPVNRNLVYSKIIK